MHSTVLEALTDTRVEVKDGKWVVYAPEMTRKSYQDFKKFFTRCQGQWVRKDAVHVFDYDPTRLFEEALTTGKLPEINPHAFFPTPLAIALDCLENAEMLGVPSKVLDPSAGSGNFLGAAKDYVEARTQQYRGWGLDTPTSFRFDAIELDLINCAKLAAKGYQYTQEDFLSLVPDPSYDLICINPPFQGDTWRKHLEHALKFLSPLGYMVAIVPISYYNKPSDIMNQLQAGLKKEWVLTKEETGFPIDTACLVYDHKASGSGQGWEEYHGYPSWYAYEASLYLDNDPDWHTLGSSEQISRLDEFITKTIRDLRISLMYDKQVKAQLSDLIVAD